MDLTPDFLKDWEKRQIIYNPMEPDDDGQIILKYNLESGDKIPIIGREELMVITGPQKTRKTLFLQCILMSKYTQNQSRTLMFQLDPNIGDIVYYDTEQPKRRVKKNRRRFHHACGLESDADDYLTFSIKSLSPNQKIEYITYSLEKLMQERGRAPGFIVIDQIADLLPARDVNNEAGVSQVHDYLSMWTEMTKACICVVIHTNRGRVNTNGKMGVILDQKTDCSFHVDMNFDDYVSVVFHKESRERRIPKFRFRQNMDGFPQLLDIDQDYNHI